MTFLESVCRAFDQAGVRYAVVGGYAVALHGAVRGTVDVDCVINWSQKSLKQAEAALNDIGLESRLPVTAEDIFQFRDEYIQNRNLLAWSFYNPGDLSQQVDLLIHFDLKGKRTKEFRLGDQVIKVLNKEALIAMKRQSGRPQDLADIRALEHLR
ncbi:MAG: hypothetical protein RLN82_06285 [Pseudomonadales bacterium]